MKKYLFTFFALLSINGLTAVHADAQSWQWGVRGNDNKPPNPNPSQDNIIDMATDPNGNVYILTAADDNMGDVDGQIINNTGYDYNAVVSSFDCEGNLRWYRVISGDYVGGSFLKTDSMGGVYVFGGMGSSFGNPTVKFGNDTTLNGGVKNQFLAKYDTSGNFKWARLPQPDTASTIAPPGITSSFWDMDVNGNGDIYLLSVLYPGNYGGNGFIVNTYGVYILKYDKDGTCTGGIPLDITASNLRGAIGSSHLKVDFTRHRYYLAGMYDTYTADPLSFGNTAITHPAYLGCFDGDGELLWVKQNTDADPLANMIFSRPGIDEYGNIYIGGTTLNGDSWGGYVFNNIFNNGYRIPYVVVVDTNGNNVWASNASSANGGNNGRAINYSNNTVAVAGSYVGQMVWGADTVANAPNQLYDIFMARFNSQTATMLSLDTLKSDFGFSDGVYGLEADKNGNFYLSGNITERLYVANDTLILQGSGYDWFLARYGSACGCTPPVAHFSYSASGPGFTFTYDGSQPVDSVLWDFGDGQQGSGNSVSHTYADTGVYSVCVTAANSCGGNTYCQYVNTEHTGIEAIPGFPQLRAYPNPATQTLTIANAPKGMSLDIYNTLGRLMLQSVLKGGKDQIDVSQLSAGIYIMRFTDKNGRRGNVKFVKE